MSRPPIEVLTGIRAAILATDAIVAQLGQFNGEPSIHTRRPIPVEAGFPAIVIGPIAAISDADGINDRRPIVAIPINTYGAQSADYRAVEQVAEAIAAMFQRPARGLLTVEFYNVTMITCRGPVPASVDDDTDVGRRVTLTISLFAN